MDSGAGDARTGLDYDICVRRTRLQHGHIPAVFPRSRYDVQYIRGTRNRAHTTQLGMATVQKLRACRGHRGGRPYQAQYPLGPVHIAGILLERHSQHSAENRWDAVQLDTDVRFTADQFRQLQLGHARDIGRHIERSGGDHRVDTGAYTGVELHQTAV